MKKYTERTTQKINEAANFDSFSTDIEKSTLDNENYREVLSTNEFSQLVLMNIEPNDEIGEETHEDGDQFIRIESGEGQAIIDGEETDLSDGSAIIIPAGAKHNIINTSDENPLKLYTIYSPPHHPEGTIHKTKEDSLE